MLYKYSISRRYVNCV
eukprot:UN20482